MNIFYTR